MEKKGYYAHCEIKWADMHVGGKKGDNKHINE